MKTENTEQRDAAMKRVQEDFRRFRVNDVFKTHAAIGLMDVQPIPWDVARRLAFDAVRFAFNAGVEWQSAYAAKDAVSETATLTPQPPDRAMSEKTNEQ